MAEHQLPKLTVRVRFPAIRSELPLVKGLTKRPGSTAIIAARSGPPRALRHSVSPTAPGPPASGLRD